MYSNEFSEFYEDGSVAWAITGYGDDSFVFLVFLKYALKQLTETDYFIIMKVLYRCFIGPLTLRNGKVPKLYALLTGLSLNKEVLRLF